MKKTSAYYTCLLGGILLLCIYFPLFSISIALYPPPFSPIFNMISDLGSPTFNPSGAIWFNVANILIGPCAVIFFIGFSVWYNDQKYPTLFVKLLQVMGLVHGIALVAVGCFPTDLGPLHGNSAITYFSTNLGILFFSYLAFRDRPKFPKWMWRLCFFIFATSMLNLIVLGRVPIVEWIAVYSEMVYEYLLLGNMVRIFRKDLSKE